jgi:O-antigen/teichoic acid export membrane protein
MTARTVEEVSTFDPINQPSEEGRGRERLKRASWAAAASLGLRGTTILSNFVVIPLTLRYLGAERYGLWVALSSVIMLLSFADCGVGYGLMNRVAASMGAGDVTTVRRSISSTFFVLFALAAAFLVLFGCIYPFIGWQSLFHAQTAGDGVASGRAVAIMVVVFLATLPFSTVQRVQFAHQEAFKSQLWQIGGVIAGLLGTIIIVLVKGDLWALALGSTIGPFLAVSANWLVQFYLVRPEYRPRLALFDRTLTKEILENGGYFLILQIANTVVFSIDSILIAHLFGPRTLTQYNLVAKLFQIGPILAGVWFAPLWPAYAEAIARGDLRWAKRTLLSSVGMSMAGTGAACAVLSFFLTGIVHLWTGLRIYPDVPLLIGFNLYALVVTGTSAVSAYLNGSNYIRGQAFLVTLHAAVSVAAKLVLSRHFGSAGVVLGTSVSYFLVIVPAYLVVVPRILKRQSISIL